jgi:uncharacterized protein
MKKRIVIAGGNGFLGKVLCLHFAETADIIILSRGLSGLRNGIRYEHWDAKTIGPWAGALENADVLVNLVGRTVDCRYNEKNKRDILESRIDSTHVLGEALKACINPPKLWINSASATRYRHALDREMDEETGETGSGFSVDVCKAWEEEFYRFQIPGVRQVALRIAIVLGRTGGAVKPLLRLAQFFMGGRQGSGEQFFSWIHEDDFARAVAFIIDHEELSGSINTVAPKPVRNKELMRTIRKAVGRPFGLPMPKWMLEIGAWMIRTETELVLKSRNVIPKRLMEAGFAYKYPDIESAITEITGKQMAISREER